MSKVLVTGGLGFIGQHVVRRMVRSGRAVVVLDLEPDDDRRARAAEELGRLEGCVVVVGDVRDRSAVDRLFRREGIAATVHLATHSSARGSVSHPRETVEVNELGTVTVLEAARKWGAYRFVLASSCSVYGSDAPRPFRESMLGTGPASPYGASKRAAELHGYAFHRVHGLNVSCLRLFSVYGPGQRRDMAVTRWIEAARRGDAAARFGSQETTRDFVHVEDVVRALDAAVRGGPDWSVVNIGSGCSTSLADLAQAVASSVGRPLELEDLPAQPGDAPSGPADTSQAKTDLGWQPTIDLATGLADWMSTVAAG